MADQSVNKEAPEFSWRDMARSLFFLLGDKKKRYLLYTGTLIVFLFYEVVPAYTVGKVVDFFTTYKPGDSLVPFYGFALFLGITYAAVSLIRLTTKRNLNILQAEVNYDARVKGFARLLDFSVKWHDNENTGNKVQRIQNGTDSLRNLQHLLSNDVFPALTQILGVLIVFLSTAPIFFLYCIIYISVFIYIQKSFTRKLTQLTEANNEHLEKASGTYYEGLSNVLTIKALGVKDDFKKNVITREEMSRDFNTKRLVLMNNKWKSFQVFNGLSMGGLVLLSGYSFLSGSITIGLIFVIYTYFQKLNGNMGESTVVIDKLIQNKVSLSRMMPIFWDAEHKDFGNERFPDSWSSIEIQNASLSFKNPNVSAESAGLRNLSILIKRNEKIGVVGKSGSGKSTFAKVLMGLYPIESGEYNLGKTNFYDIDHDEITQKISLVLQDSEMFNLTLRENITLMRKLDEGLLKQAIEIAELQSLIDKLPEGLDTLIGEKGYRLSGGERQRLGIARALYKDPEILILDEATSSLDSKTENLILKSLEERLTKKTVISIAHRISTLKNTNRVIVFEDGHIVEEGTYNELSKDKSSKFFEISHTQK